MVNMPKEGEIKLNGKYMQVYSGGWKRIVIDSNDKSSIYDEELGEYINPREPLP